MKQLLKISALAVLVSVVASCSGTSSQDSTEAPVFVTVEIRLYSPDIDICGRNWDIDITTMSVSNELKNPNGQITPQQDVVIPRSPEQPPKPAKPE